ncbi:MAG TPA: glucose-1-phosphate cytidylyltransferase [Polyangiaceae bacterium]|jgi:glucose-1-phosphate cytidylyltransferase|nr:glucose-1-phosphate cytidylyltransferase [Polyangiaceae bacterium]
MKLVILAGGLGTRLSEETAIKPKPMVEVGGRPILWHILKIYSSFGINEVIICGGYRADVIKDFFHGYFIRNSDVTFDMRNDTIEVHSAHREPWRVTVVDTGQDTMTGGRVRRVREHIGGERFHLTYGDGVADLDINALNAFHEREGALVTLTAVSPPGRFGALMLHEGSHKVASFREKPRGDGAWVNGGFFVVEPEALDYIAGDSTSWEQEPLRDLARDGKLSAYRHDGFWQAMDTLRDKNYLEELWAKGKAPWKRW